mmetsp:Transcript_2265/g.8746  ORF Transcript_2265/g.8746 Transcript_2265/m.8746 type:complete len:800 (-) Transcript_2265:3757-6156(-)
MLGLPVSISGSRGLPRARPSASASVAILPVGPHIQTRRSPQCASNVRKPDANAPSTPTTIPAMAEMSCVSDEICEMRRSENTAERSTTSLSSARARAGFTSASLVRLVASRLRSCGMRPVLTRPLELPEASTEPDEPALPPSMPPVGVSSMATWGTRASVSECRSSMRDTFPSTDAPEAVAGDTSPLTLTHMPSASVEASRHATDCTDQCVRRATSAADRNWQPVHLPRVQHTGPVPDCCSTDVDAVAASCDTSPEGESTTSSAALAQATDRMGWNTASKRMSPVAEAARWAFSTPVASTLSEELRSVLAPKYPTTSAEARASAATAAASVNTPPVTVGTTRTAAKRGCACATRKPSTAASTGHMKVLAHGKTSISPRTTSTAPALMPSDTCSVQASSSTFDSCSSSGAGAPAGASPDWSDRPAARARLALASSWEDPASSAAPGSAAGTAGVSPVGSFPRSCSSVCGSSTAWAAPAGQRSRASGPEHATHAVPWSSVPAGHALQVLLPSADTSPSPQGRQEASVAAPDAGWNVPAGQGSQSIEPSTEALTKPGEQSSHSASRPPALAVPALQGRQSDPPVPAAQFATTGTHASAADSPTASVVEPAGHVVQPSELASPASVPYVPMGQGSAVAPSGQYLPGTHLTHIATASPLSCTACLTVPGLHSFPTSASTVRRLSRPAKTSAATSSRAFPVALMEPIASSTARDSRGSTTMRFMDRSRDWSNRIDVSAPVRTSHSPEPRIETAFSVPPAAPRVSRSRTSDERLTPEMLRDWRLPAKLHDAMPPGGSDLGAPRPAS